jgi:hypothetical protein
MRHPIVLSFVFLAACQVETPPATDEARGGDGMIQQPAPRAQLPFEKELLAIAGNYRQWDRVSDYANWAPTLCRIPPRVGAQHSRSEDDATHGRKLYFLFAKDAAAYKQMPFLDLEEADARDAMARKLTGQVVVKESWLPVEVPLDSVPKIKPKTVDGHVIPADYAIDGEHAFRTGAAAGLFVMLKLDPGTPGTDQGWVYGTLTADGRTVTASGRLTSCMECHESARHERLFGMSQPFRRLAGPSKR